VKSRFTVVLTMIEHLPAALSLTQLLQPHGMKTVFGSVVVEEKLRDDDVGSQQLTVDALRLVELTDRTSAVMRSALPHEELLNRDPLVSVFRTFGRLHGIRVTSALSVVGTEDFPATISGHAKEAGTQMVVLPWSMGSQSPVHEGSVVDMSHHSPFDGLFGKAAADKTSWIAYSHFVRKVFIESPVDVTVFVDRTGATHAGGAHLFMPFFGGPDDRLALSFVIQLCKTVGITATVVRIRTGAGAPALVSDAHAAATNQLTVHSVSGAMADTHYGSSNTQTRLQSDTADNLIWSQLTSTSSMADRISFSTVSSATPLKETLNLLDNAIHSPRHASKTILAVLGRGKRMPAMTHATEVKELLATQQSSLDNEVKKTLGDVAAAVILTNTLTNNIMVLQAAPPFH